MQGSGIRSARKLRSFAESLDFLTETIERLESTATNGQLTLGPSKFHTCRSGHRCLAAPSYKVESLVSTQHTPNHSRADRRCVGGCSIACEQTGGLSVRNISAERVKNARISHLRCVTRR